jgi:hypothetical protein
VSKGTDDSGLGSLGSGAVTAAALAVQSGLAAVVGVILARKFGRGAETDGFFAAYGVFIVLALAATAIRVTVLPPLARARDSGRLAGETAAYALTLTVVAVPALGLALALPDQIAAVLTGDGPQAAQDTAADALPWMVLAATGQLYAGLAASALASLDDYVVAAAGFAVGSILGLAFILVRVDADGVVAISWGMALNGAIALLVPTAALALRAARAGAPRQALRPGGVSSRARLAEMARGVTLPLALQAIYVVSLPLAAREGVGAVTSFGFAYLAASAVVAVTASSLGLVTSVPLTRAGLDAARTSRHVTAASWIALVFVAAAAGVFVLAGEPIVSTVLGPDYAADVGDQLGRLVAFLAPWSVAAVGFSVAFPLLFVAGPGNALPVVAVLLVLLQVPLALAGRAVADLEGLELAMATTAVLLLGAILHRLRALRAAARGVAAAAVVLGSVTLAAFVPPGLLLGPVAAAAGLALYAGLLALLRPSGLVSAWRYLRALT